jgi:tetratricopeptide (TPR) repeat protein
LSLKVPNLECEIDLVNIFLSYGGVLEKIGDINGAKSNFLRAYEVGMKNYGSKNPIVAAICVRLARVDKKLENYDEAMDYIVEALNIFEKVYEKDNEDVRDADTIFDEIIAIKRKKGKL